MKGDLILHQGHEVRKVRESVCFVIFAAFCRKSEFLSLGWPTEGSGDFISVYSMCSVG